MRRRPPRSTLFPYTTVFNYTATTEIYTLSLHDALPISVVAVSSDEIERLRQEVTKRGLNLIYAREWLQPASFPAEHNHNLTLTLEQWDTWIRELKQADIMLDFEVNTLSRWVP